MDEPTRPLEVVPPDIRRALEAFGVTVSSDSTTGATALSAAISPQLGA
jgi:hypothetical protein